MALARPGSRWDPTDGTLGGLREANGNRTRPSSTRPLLTPGPGPSSGPVRKRGASPPEKGDTPRAAAIAFHTKCPFLNKKRLGLSNDSTEREQRRQELTRKRRKLSPGRKAGPASADGGGGRRAAGGPDPLPPAGPPGLQALVPPGAPAKKGDAPPGAAVQPRAVWGPSWLLPLPTRKPARSNHA